jgi:site-specific DNA-cytosine methylase
MRVLVACEYSGVVRDAFIAHGHEAWSCDLLPTDSPGPHIQGDVFKVIKNGWDLMIAHPPCTHLAVSGNRWYAGSQERLDAIEFFRRFLDAPISKICVENPVGAISKAIRPPDQYIQPYWFGHPESKKTGLWLKGLEPLEPTNVVEEGPRHVTKSGRSLPVWYNLPPSADRWKIRSKTFKGIADAMASQWG